MAELRASIPGSDLYERLLQRIAQALNEADTAERLHGERPDELELEGLSSSEMELIRAYLEQDVSWLKGWHAAAHELAMLEQQRAEQPEQPVSPAQLRLVPRPQHLQCALCGTPVGWSNQGVLPCTCCGSQLFRNAQLR